MIGALVLLLILGIIPGLIYLAYYYTKDLKCPKCGSKDWGSDEDVAELKREEKMRQAMNYEYEYKAGDYICNDCLAKKENCDCDAKGGFKRLTESQAKRMNDINRE